MPNKNDTILPDSVAIFPHLLAYDLAFKNQVAAIPLQNLLVYIVDNVPAAALPLLADQFDVLGYKGLALCDTEQDQRNLIKQAIALHRYKGTIWAVKQALKSIGFTDIKIIEHTSGNWATFKVVITNEDVILTQDSITKILAMINEYKGCRNKMETVQMTLQFNDTIYLDEDSADVLAEIHADDTIYLSGALRYDGTGNYNGINDYSGELDTVTITP